MFVYMLNNHCHRVTAQLQLNKYYYYLKKLVSVCVCMSIPVATQSKAWVCGCSFARIVLSNPAEGMSVCFECCVSGRGLCDELITCPEDSNRLWCAWVWSWIVDNEETLAQWGAVAPWTKFIPGVLINPWPDLLLLLLFSFSVQGTGGSPMGPDPENRVGDQDIGSPGRPVSSGL
jgi:hypothetical protein